MAKKEKTISVSLCLPDGTVLDKSVIKPSDEWIDEMAKLYSEILGYRPRNQ